MTSQRRIVLVTGPSGAGRSTAIHVLEDLGFEAIDNLPMGLLLRLLDSAESDRPMALALMPAIGIFRQSDLSSWPKNWVVWRKWI